MGGLFGGGSKPTPPPPVAPPPQVDDAQQRLNEQDRAAKRVGRKTTVLTGDNGLPDLGTTTRTGQ
jgi:hypothetical protein